MHVRRVGARGRERAVEIRSALVSSERSPAVRLHSRSKTFPTWRPTASPRGIVVCIARRRRRSSAARARAFSVRQSRRPGEPGMHPWHDRASTKSSVLRHSGSCRRRARAGSARALPFAARSAGCAGRAGRRARGGPARSGCRGPCGSIAGSRGDVHRWPALRRFHDPGPLAHHPIRGLHRWTDVAIWSVQLEPGARWTLSCARLARTATDRRPLLDDCASSRGKGGMHENSAMSRRESPRRTLRRWAASELPRPRCMPANRE